MYRYYIVPDATKLNSHAAIYQNMQLLWDPKTESDAYAILEPNSKDELNKSASLEFTVLPANIHYNDFHKHRTVVVVYDDNDWLFEGVVTDAPLDFYKRRKVTCSDPLSFLTGSIQAPDEKNQIEVSTSGGGSKYVVVPTAWYTGANPKSLNWYEQTIDTIYDAVLETDVFISGREYYIKSGNTYSIWSGGLNEWASRPQLYIAAGRSPSYSKTKDTEPNADKRYYYLSTSNSENYSGSTTVSAAATKESIIKHIERLLNVHNSQVDPFRKIHLGRMYNDNDTTEREFKAANFRTTWDALKTDILDDYGKYFRIELGDDHELYLNYLELQQLPTVAPEQAPLVEFANNLMEMSESDENDDDLFTVLVPIGKDNLTVKDVSGHSSPEYSGATHDVDPYIASWGGNKRYVVVSPKAINKYGYIIKTQSFSDVDKADTLWDRAKKYIQNNYDDHTEYQVKAIDLRFINGSGKRISVGERVRLHSQWHGVDTRELYVISSEHDLVNPENDSYRIGIPTSDREANNRTLTGQTNAAKSKNASNQASNSSSMSRMHSILEDYIHVTEWGLEMNTRLKNEVESNDGKYMTRFIQDEEHINMAAQKLFGVDEDGRGDKDAGYNKVPKSEYRKVPNDTSTPYKNPSEEHWFEKSGSNYTLSTDTTCDPSVVGNKDYYRQRLWTRYSDIDVGPGGIKATVDGNYERSTYCSSWIQANEDAILAITGHIHVDENGQVIIDGGAGVRTGHTSDRVDVHYQAVPKSMYSKSPVSQKWYERVMNSAGTWTGSGVSESVIMQGATPAALGPNESKYYKRSTDSTANPDKYYYIRQSVSEEFTAEYGVYDENNLTGGVVARMVNNPQYFPVDDGTIKEAADLGKTAYELGWYLYNSSTGEFGLGLAGDVVNEHTKYYTKKNNSEVWTDLRGDHIVIGPAVTSASEGMSDQQRATESRQALIQRYLGNNKHLNGTICEISSDVVSINALFVEYLHWEEAEGEYLDIDGCDVEWATIEHLTLATDGDDEEVLDVYGDANFNYNVSVMRHFYALDADFDSLTIGSVSFGSSSWNPGDAEEYEDDFSVSGNNPANIVMGFGTITTEGDLVKIPYYLAGDEEHVDSGDNAHILSFEKPASIGRAVWSSGSGGVHDLKVYTVGGWNGGESPQWVFYHAQVTYPTNFLVGAKDSEDHDRIVYKRNGSEHTDKGSMSTTLNSKPTIKAHMELSGEDWNKDGQNVGLYHVDTSDDTPVIPGWSKYIFIDASEPFTDGQNDAKSKTTLTNISKFTPGNDTELNEYVASISQATAYDSYYSYNINYDGALFGDKKYFKTPSKGSVRTYANFDNDRDGVAEDIVSGTIGLRYGENVTVYGQKKMDGEDSWTEALLGVKVSAPSKPTISSPASATAPSGVTPTSLSYGTTYEVHLVSGSTNEGNNVYFKAPSDNSTDPEEGDIQCYKDTGTDNAGYTSQGSGYNQLFKDVTFTNQKWYRFRVECTGSTMKKTTKYYAIYVKTS